MESKPLKSIRHNTPSVKSYVQAIKKDSQHVTPKGDSWQVKKSESLRATKHFSTQKDAIQYAREIARKQQTELFVHGTNGRIRERNSYGKDSFPPRG